MNPVSINRQLNDLHRRSREAAYLAASSRDSIRYYKLHPEVEPYQSVEFHADRVRSESRKEAAALREINDILLDAGLVAGQQVETEDGHLYRASNPGRLASYLGKTVPHDVAYHAGHSTLDEAPEDDAWDEKREWASDYMDAIGVFG